MKSKKVLSLLITCAMTASMGTTVFASTEDQIAAAQAQKQAAIMENLKDHAAQITQTISAGLSAGRIYKNIIKEQEE